MSQSKIFIESTEEQMDNLKNCRKSLKVLQKTATDKENLIGRLPAFVGKEHLTIRTQPDVASTPDTKRIKAATSTQSCQTGSPIDVVKQLEKDLTEDTVSENYWEKIAEQRRVALEESLIENEELYEKIGTLEAELNESKKLLDETRNLVEVLTEMLQESNTDTSMSEAVDEKTSDADSAKDQDS